MLFEKRISDYIAETGAQGSRSAVLVPRVQVVTPATEDPVTLAELKTYLRIDGNSEDDLLGGLITSATAAAENWTGRAFITRTLKAWFDRCPDGMALELPHPPVTAITTVSTFDDADTETTFATTNYIADIYGEPARVCLRNAASWPTDLRSANALAVRFTAGYGAAAAVPAGIKEAIKALAAHAYEWRGAQKTADNAMTVEGAPALVRELLRPYQILNFGL